MTAPRGAGLVSFAVYGLPADLAAGAEDSAGTAEGEAT